MTVKKHLGRAGHETQPVCNGGSSRLRYAGVSRLEFKRGPKQRCCVRCMRYLERQLLVETKYSTGSYIEQLSAPKSES